MRQTTKKGGRGLVYGGVKSSQVGGAVGESGGWGGWLWQRARAMGGWVEADGGWAWRGGRTWWRSAAEGEAAAGETGGGGGDGSARGGTRSCYGAASNSDTTTRHKRARGGERLRVRWWCAVGGRCRGGEGEKEAVW